MNDGGRDGVELQYGTEFREIQNSMRCNKREFIIALARMPEPDLMLMHTCHGKNYAKLLNLQYDGRIAIVAVVNGLQFIVFYVSVLS